MKFPQYTQEEFETLYNAYMRGDILINEAFDKVSPNALHFIKTGTTLEEWDEYYGSGGTA